MGPSAVGPRRYNVTVPQPPQGHRLDYAQYLEHERGAEVRHEFVDGEVFSMAGGSREHGLVQTAVVGTLGRLLQGRPCPRCASTRW